MTIVDKIIGAVTPPESEEAREKARAKARAAARPGSWLTMVLDHHLLIEAGFSAVKNAPDAAQRRRAEKDLALLLTAHSNAEESVLYPALALHGEKVHSGSAYTQQAATKVQMAALEDLDPMGQDYLDKLEHIRGAVAHHIYEEEGNWFLDLHDKLESGKQQTLAKRYTEEFVRNTGADAPSLGRKPVGPARAAAA